MPVNDIIKTIDYNSVQNKIANVIGPGSVTFGWNQSLSSKTVTEGDKVTINEWANLRNDIINGYRHVFGQIPSIVQATSNTIIRYNDSGTTPEQATEPVVQYDRWVDQIIDNRFNLALPSTFSKGSQFRVSPWSVRVESTVTVTFTTADQARFFFNSGGQIRIMSTRSHGAPTAQNNSWTSILSSAGTVGFGAQVPSEDFSPMNGQNFYRLTDSYQLLYSIFGSGPYTQNAYRIFVRSNVSNNSSGTADQIEFLVEWEDSYVDPDILFGRPDGNWIPPDDIVDGTLMLSVSTLEARGALIPASLGNFTVESPSVTISEITGS